ncbi:MAG: FtsX-like permease family protein [Phycisphaeraceae bacterium]|nr:FtsX-like permease family protein [Phycisphaerales bacterium]MCB9843036.1 FtsX-like permease family protein [Phycisphaeraceae bacterium]
MLRTLRLSISALAARRSRTALLIAAVSLSATLVTALACGLASLNAGLEWRVTSALGKADLRVRHAGTGRFDDSVLDVVRASPDVRLAAPTAQGPLQLRLAGDFKTIAAVGVGIDPSVEYQIVPREVSRGRRVERDAEMVLDAKLAEQLQAELGMRIELASLGAQQSWTLVGIIDARSSEAFRKPEAVITLSDLQRATGYAAMLTQIQAILNENADPNLAAERLGESLPIGVLAEPTERVTSGMNDSIKANQFALIIMSNLAFLAAAFIVLTGLTTNVQERQRELGILRCIGGTRAQLASTQLIAGVVIGAFGALVGIPFGIALTYILTQLLPDRLPAGLAIPAFGMTIAIAGSTVAGLIGALWPAWTASRASPLGAMTARAHATSRRTIVVLTAIAIALIAIDPIFLALVHSPTAAFWGHAFVGVPALFVGFFLLGVPIVLLVTRSIGALLSIAFALPKRVVPETIRATPLRHGFTAGALMVGLSLMTSVWSLGTSFVDDWLDALDFPEAFVNGWRGLSDDTRDKIDRLPFVENTCAITLQKVRTDAFKIGGIVSPKTTFVAFEPDRLFSMVNLHWVAGDEATAKRRLNEGGAVLVAKEFTVQREGFGVGDTLTVELDGRTKSFEIVGVVSSPGLDILSKYFDIGKEAADRSMHSVFGSRADLINFFANDSIDLIQIKLKGDISDEDATNALRAAVGDPFAVVGSGREIKEDIISIGRGSIRIAIIVAIGAMVLGALGVANVVIAGIDARRFELGVFRSIGATPATLARLVICEILIVAIAACVLGTLMGIAIQPLELRMYELLAGVELPFRPLVGPVLLGSAILIAITMLMVLPIALRTARAKPLALLSATRG